jgi:hypothetical protein
MCILLFFVSQHYVRHLAIALSCAAYKIVLDRSGQHDRINTSNTYQAKYWLLSMKQWIQYAYKLWNAIEYKNENRTNL